MLRKRGTRVASTLATCIRLRNALNPDHPTFDAELRREWKRLDKQTRGAIWDDCGLISESRPFGALHAERRLADRVVASMDKFAKLRSMVMARAPPASIDEEAPLHEDASDAPLDDDLLREIAFDDGRRPRQADEASEVSGVTVSSRATFASRATSAYTAVPTAHGQSRMQEREVSLRDLQAAKKYGTITRAHDGVRGDKRWKIEYGDVVYITDAQQKLVITTYQLRPRADSLYIGPAPPPPTYPPPMYMPPAPYNIPAQRPGRWPPPTPPRRRVARPRTPKHDARNTLSHGVSPRKSARKMVDAARVLSPRNVPASPAALARRAALRPPSSSHSSSPRTPPRVRALEEPSPGMSLSLEEIAGLEV